MLCPVVVIVIALVAKHVAAFAAATGDCVNKSLAQVGTSTMSARPFSVLRVKQDAGKTVRQPVSVVVAAGDAVVVVVVVVKVVVVVGPVTQMIVLVKQSMMLCPVVETVIAEVARQVAAFAAAIGD